MALIHHVITGQGRPPVVFVHGFACAHTDWAAQVAHFAPRHRTIAVDLRGHGASPGTPADSTIERHGADVAELMRALNLPPAILVGHSMGCRVVVEAALQAPAHTAGVILIDGSQFAASMGANLQALFTTDAGFAAVTSTWFTDMFTARSDPAVVAAALQRAGRLPREIGQPLLLDLQRYDTVRLTASLASLHVPLLAIQTTFTNENRERTTMRRGQASRYLGMLRTAIRSVRVEIIPDTGHFPQIDEPAQTNALIDSFLTSLPG